MASRTSLRLRIAVGLATLACIGVGMQFAVFGRIAERMRDDVASRNQGLAHALAGEVSNAIAQPAFALSVLARQLETGLSGENLRKTLESLRRFTKVVELVQVLDADGRVQAMAPANADQLSLDFSNQPFFRMAREHAGRVFSESFISSQTSVPAATISEGYQGGVAAIQLRVEEISRMAKAAPPKGGGFVAVVDNKGVVIGHSDSSVALRRESLLNLAAVRVGLSGEEASFQNEVFESVPGIASVSPVAGTGWLVLVFEPAANAYALVRNLYSYTLGGVAVVALCSLLAMLAFQAQLLKPLEQFTRQARAVSGGRYDVAINPAFREFEPLAESFVTMSDALKAREQALNQSRRRLSSVVEAMPSFLAAADGAGMVELWNVEAEKLTGVTAQDALGRPLEEAAGPLVMILPALEQSAVLGLPVKWEKLGLDFGRGRRIVDVLVYPLATDDQGGEGGAVLRIDDVTDRIRMEEVMVHTEKMMTVGGLAAGMAHEINNPLGGIIMSAQNVARRLSPELPANRKAAAEVGLDLTAMNAYLQARGIFDQVEAIRELGARAGKIVANMLGFSRRSSSGFIPVKIEELVGRALDLAANDYELKQRLDFKTITVECSYDPDLSEIPVNRSQIEQVLLNLFKNAAQAMSETASTRAPRLWITSRCEGDDAILEVRDNGPGIPDHIRERIFEPFFTTKEVGQGTGLGLSVSYYIVTTMHKGSIGVQSTPGEGAAFTVMLPLRRAYPLGHDHFGDDPHPCRGGT